MVITCEQVDSIEYFRFIYAIFQEVVSFEVLIVICEDDVVFEVDEVGGNDMVVDNLIGDFGEEEIEVDIVFFVEVFVDWLCLRKSTVHCIPGRFHLCLLFE